MKNVFTLAFGKRKLLEVNNNLPSHQRCSPFCGTMHVTSMYVSVQFQALKLVTIPPTNTVSAFQDTNNWDNLKNRVEVEKLDPTALLAAKCI